MTQDNTPPGPIFESLVTPHQVRFHHQTIVFSESCLSDISNDTLFGADTFFTVE